MDLTIKLEIDCEHGIAGDIVSLPSDIAIELCEIGAAVPTIEQYERGVISYEKR